MSKAVQSRDKVSRIRGTPLGPPQAGELSAVPASETSTWSELSVSVSQRRPSTTPISPPLCGQGGPTVDDYQSTGPSDLIDDARKSTGAPCPSRRARRSREPGQPGSASRRPRDGSGTRAPSRRSPLVPVDSQPSCTRTFRGVLPHNAATGSFPLVQLAPNDPLGERVLLGRRPVAHSASAPLPIITDLVAAVTAAAERAERRLTLNRAENLSTEVPSSPPRDPASRWRVWQVLGAAEPEDPWPPLSERLNGQVLTYRLPVGGHFTLAQIHKFCCGLVWWLNLDDCNIALIVSRDQNPLYLSLLGCLLAAFHQISPCQAGLPKAAAIRQELLTNIEGSSRPACNLSGALELNAASGWHSVHERYLGYYRSILAAHRHVVEVPVLKLKSIFVNGFLGNWETVEVEVYHLFDDETTAGVAKLPAKRRRGSHPHHPRRHPETADSKGIHASMYSGAATSSLDSDLAMPGNQPYASATQDVEPPPRPMSTRELYWKAARAYLDHPYVCDRFSLNAVGELCGKHRSVPERAAPSGASRVAVPTTHSCLGCPVEGTNVSSRLAGSVVFDFGRAVPSSNVPRDLEKIPRVSDPVVLCGDVLIVLRQWTAYSENERRVWRSQGRSELDSAPSDPRQQILALYQTHTCFMENDALQVSASDFQYFLIHGGNHGHSRAVVEPISDGEKALPPSFNMQVVVEKLPALSSFPSGPMATSDVKEDVSGVTKRRHRLLTGRKGLSGAEPEDPDLMRKRGHKSRGEYWSTCLDPVWWRRQCERHRVAGLAATATGNPDEFRSRLAARIVPVSPDIDIPQFAPAHASVGAQPPAADGFYSQRHGFASKVLGGIGRGRRGSAGSSCTEGFEPRPRESASERSMPQTDSSQPPSDSGKSSQPGLTSKRNQFLKVAARLPGRRAPAGFKPSIPRG